MRLLRSILVAFTVATVGLTASAATSSSPTVVMPGQIHWAAQPGNFSMGVLYGDPSKSGFYVMRLKLPANWTYPAHYHPGRENVTVISGTFYAGLGTKMDKAKGIAFPAGSFVSMPPDVRHYAFTKSGPVVIQIEGNGPSQDIMVKK